MKSLDLDCSKDTQPVDLGLALVFSAVFIIFTQPVFKLQPSKISFINITSKPNLINCTKTCKQK